MNRLKSRRISLKSISISLILLSGSSAHPELNSDCIQYFLELSRERFIQAGKSEEWIGLKIPELEQSVLTLEKISQALFELKNTNSPLTKLKVNNLLIEQLEELFTAMEIPTSRISKRVKAFSGNEEVEIGEQFSLQIDPSALKDHYPLMNRVFNQSTLKKPGQMDQPLKLFIGDFTDSSFAFYSSRPLSTHEVVIAQGLEAVLDILVGGGMEPGIVWHEVMHSIFQKRRLQGKPNSVFDLTLNSASEMTSTEEIYNHLNEPIWRLRNLKVVQGPQNQWSSFTLSKEVLILSNPEKGYWIHQQTKLLTEIKKLLQPLRKLISKKTKVNGLKISSNNTLIFKNGNYSAEIYMDPIVKESILSGRLDEKSYIQNKLKQADDLIAEAEKHLKELRKEVITKKDHLMDLSFNDPEKCRQELLKLYQKHLFFLKSHFSGI